MLGSRCVAALVSGEATKGVEEPQSAAGRASKQHRHSGDRKWEADPFEVEQLPGGTLGPAPRWPHTRRACWAHRCPLGTGGTPRNQPSPPGCPPLKQELWASPCRSFRPPFKPIPAVGTFASFGAASSMGHKGADLLTAVSCSCACVRTYTPLPLSHKSISPHREGHIFQRAVRNLPPPQGFTAACPAPCGTRPSTSSHSWHPLAAGRCRHAQQHFSLWLSLTSHNPTSLPLWLNWESRRDTVIRRP